MAHLAAAVSLGLLATSAPLALGVPARPPGPNVMLRVTARPEDDRGSGRFSRMPALVDSLSFRGSGRVEPNPPASNPGWLGPLAYRGSGRITQPCPAKASVGSSLSPQPTPPA